jgi:DNA-binding NtrC family response regulator
MQKKVLVIDDEAIITTTVSNLLKREGYHPVSVQSGEEAIDRIQSDTFDLIIADIKMPKLDGPQTIKAINAYLEKENKPEVPVIFITGYANSEGYVKIKKFGEIIFKPFDMHDFLSAVANTLK